MSLAFWDNFQFYPFLYHHPNRNEEFHQGSAWAKGLTTYGHKLSQAFGLFEILPDDKLYLNL